VQKVENSNVLVTRNLLTITVRLRVANDSVACNCISCNSKSDHDYSIPSNSKEVSITQTRSIMAHRGS